MSDGSGSRFAAVELPESAEQDGVPLIVISGVNLVEGGTLTAFREMARAAASHQPRCRVIALVNRPGLLGIPQVTELSFPDIKQSWLKRLWFEWVVLRSISRKLGADVWVSMHDITPVIATPRQFVYCHNPAPFSKIPMRKAWQDKTFWLFTLFYGSLYGVNILRNTAVIVQQQWLREEFERRYGMKRIIVAHPTGIPARIDRRQGEAGRPVRFLYPTMPRVFKNIEAIGNALQLLESDLRWRGVILITIDGSENAYARRLVEKYGGLRSLHFIGLQSHDAMDNCYASVDALVFPSLLETWGLPLSEAKARNLPVVAADLPYAHETVGDYAQASFFDPHDAQSLASLLLSLHLGEARFQAHSESPPDQPFAAGWSELVSMLLSPMPRSPSHQLSDQINA